MAIATGTAALIAAGAGAAASVYGASQNARAASQGAAAITNASQQSEAEARRQFDLTRSDQMPFIQSGWRRLAAQDQLLGIQGGNAGMATTGPAMMTQSGPDYGSYVRNNADLLNAFNASNGRWGGMEDFGAIHFDTHGRGEGRQVPMFSNPNETTFAASGGANQAQGGGATQAANDPLAGFRASGFYQIDDDPRIRQGTNAAFSAKGMGLDGAAQVAMGRALQSNLYGRLTDYSNTLSGGAAQGLGAVQGLGALGANMAANNASSRMGAANAMASSFQQRANATNQGLGGVMGAFGWYGQNQGWWGR